jgi:hypothetical protein
MMHPISRKTIVWAVIIALLGIGIGLLPWYQLTVFGSRSIIAGRNLWQGKAVICLFVSLGVLTVIFRRSPRWHAACLIAFGAAAAGVAGQYIIQVIFPAPTRIEVYEGGEIARALADNVVVKTNGHLSFGAPMTVFFGLGLVIVGAWQWRSTRMSQPILQTPNNDPGAEK